MVEVRYDLYLDPSDHGYEKHHVHVPIIPKEGYPGETDGNKNPVATHDYKKWIQSLPTEARDNPFLCHFCQFEPEVTDGEIAFIGDLAAQETYKKWAKDEYHALQNLPVEFKLLTRERAAACAARIAALQAKRESL